ncbi:MAG: helix-turn-helix transcriptional regulator [Oscillospiraceae bacterium]|nr:helix-turn-helix transcriptional regulator [Oscillospiraceae bacterium]
MARLKRYIAVDNEKAVSDTRFTSFFPFISHSSYEWERQLFTYVKAGDVEGFKRFMQYMLSSGQLDSARNTLLDTEEHSRFLAVAMISLFTRVAINCGVDELWAYEVSDRFLFFLHRCTDAEQILPELIKECTALVQAVHDTQEILSDNIYFTRCRDYISNHLGQKITVLVLAEICGLSPNYLSTVFKRASGKTIKQYILEQRILVSKQLLLDPDYDIDEITSFLGFASQSHFIETFKKQVGTTPRRWRMRTGKGMGVELYPEP